MRLSFIALLLLFYFPILGQDLNLEAFNTQRLEINKKGMTVLGGWAVSNMTISALSLGNASPEARAFHQMNLGWNAVNLIIAGIGYRSANRASNTLDFMSTIKEQERIRSILLFNSGLDLGYIIGGFYLLERAQNDLANTDQLNGFGKAVIMNGAFLFAFDVLMVYVHSKHGKKGLYQLSTMLRPTPGGIALQFRF